MAWREHWNADWHRTNREFHLALGSACGSPRVLQILNSLFDQSQRYGLRFLQRHGVVARFANDHNQIIEAILAQDAEAACDQLRAHLEQVRSDLVTVAKAQFSP
jgi:DNA-binding GntR family transcriptional regulator